MLLNPLVVILEKPQKSSDLEGNGIDNFFQYLIFNVKCFKYPQKITCQKTIILSTKLTLYDKKSQLLKKLVLIVF